MARAMQLDVAKHSGVSRSRRPVQRSCRRRRRHGPDRSEAERALDAGAQHLVTPNVNQAVVAAVVDRSVAVYPGGLTPTELRAGWDAGAAAVKIFPAQAVGPGYLTPLHGPYADLRRGRPGGVDLNALRQRCWAVRAVVADSVSP